MQSVPSPIELDEVGLRKHSLSFTDSQNAFVEAVISWCKNPSKELIVLSGGPGTGKTHVVKTVLNHVKVEQLRMSYTARSAQAIGGKTIHSAFEINFRGLCHELEKRLAEEPDLMTTIRESAEVVGEFKYFDDPLIIIIDEVSMISGWFMYWLIRFLFDRTTKPVLIVLIGDEHQLPPVQSIHNLFSFPPDVGVGFTILRIHLRESKRFTREYEKIIDELRVYVDRGDEEGLFAFLNERFPVCEDIDGMLLSQADRAMAAKNERVNTFNAYYLKNMIGGVEIRIGEKIFLKSGCIISVTKNGCSSVANGTELEFVRYRKKDDRLICRDLNTREEVIVRKDFESKKFPVTVAFAATIHKFQGNTIDNARIVIHLDGNRNLNMIYTAVSRVRDMTQILGITF